MDPDNLPKFVYLHKNHKYRLKLGFNAAPSNPKIFSKSVRDELNNSKFTYCSDLNGLVMGFGGISSCEVIQADTRNCISVAVYVDVFIFRPPVGSIIEAVVNQTSCNHISCLVHKLFNISIVRPENQPYDQWSGSKIKKDDKINVKVLSFDLTKKLPHITGDIVDNEINELNNSQNENNCSPKYSSSSKESECYFSESIKHIEKKSTSSSSSESSDESNSTMIHSKKFGNKFSEEFSLPIQTTQMNNHIKSPLGSSTPVSQHSIKNINTIRNKQLEQLQKHLAKNSAEKRKILESNDNYVVNNISQSSNDNVSNLPAATIDDNSNVTKEINKHCNLQSDSGISGDELKQIQVSNQNSFFNTSKESTKVVNKYNNSGTVVSASVQSAQSPKKNKPEANVLVDSNTDTSSSDNEENSVYTQYTNKINNLDKKELLLTQLSPDIMKCVETLNENSKSKSLNESKVIESALSTKSIQKSNSPSKKDLKDCKNLTEEKSVKTPVSDVLSDTSDLEESSDDDNMILPIKKNFDPKDSPKEKINNVSPGSKINITNNQYVSSSDDEIYTKLRQNTSNVKELAFTQQSPGMMKSLETLNENNLGGSKNFKESKVIQSTLKLSTKRIQKSNSPSKKGLKDCKNLTEEKSVKTPLSDVLLDASGSEKSSDDIILPIKMDIGHKDNLKEKTENVSPGSKMNIDNYQYTSSSDDEIYTKLRQNTSNIKNTKSLTNKTKNKTPHEISSSDDESILSSKLHGVSSTNSTKSNTTKLNSVNKLQTSKCYVNNDSIKKNNLLSKEEKKKKEVNKHSSTVLQSKNNCNNINTLLPNLIGEENDINKHLLKVDSNSDDEVKCKSATSNNDEFKLTESKFSSKLPTSSFPKLNEKTVLSKSMSNPFLRFYAGNSSSSSSDDETFINVPKSKELNQSSKKINSPLKKKENKKEILIRQVLTSIKHIDKTHEHKLPATHISKNSNSSEVKNKELKKGKLKSKKRLSKKITNFEDPKSNLAIQNISLKDNVLQMETQPSSDESNDEVDLIKKILEKQNLTKNNDVPELIMQSKTSSKLNKSRDNLINNVFKNSNSSEDGNKLNKNQKSKIKGKKGISEKITNFEDPKPNLPNQNISLKDSVLQMKTQPSSDESDDEVDLIKKILEKQNLTKNTDVPKLIMQGKTSSKLNKSRDNLINNVFKNSNSSEDGNKLNKNQESKVKDKKGISKKLTNFEDPKSNLSSQNISQKGIMVQMETQSSSDESNNEDDLIKKFIEERNVKKTKNNVPELIMQSEDSSKLNNKSKDNLISSVSKNSNSFEGNIKLGKSKKNKDKKEISKKLTNFENPKSNLSSQNISQKEGMLQFEIQPSSDESNDEIDLIKKLLEKKQTTKTDEPRLVIQSETSTKLNKKSKDNVSKNSNSYENSNKLNKSKKFKKGISKNLTNFEDPKHISTTLNDNMFQLKTHPSSNKSNNEVDFIKKNVEKQNIKKTKKTDLPQLITQSNISTKSNPQIETLAKLNNKSKTLKASEDRSIKNVAKKRPKESKKLLHDSIISAIDDSSSDHGPPTKKKKKKHSLNIESNDTPKIINDHVNSSEVKKKKKKKKKDKSFDDLNVKQQNVLIEEKNSDVKGKKDKKKKAERIEQGNSVQDHAQHMQTDKLSKVNDKLINRIVKSGIKTESVKKKKNDSLKSKIRQFQLSQDDQFVEKLNDLYRSFYQNDG